MNNRFDETIKLEQNLFRVRKGNLFGLYKNEQEILPPEFLNIIYYREVVIVTHKNYKMSIYFIDINKLTEEYDDILLHEKIIIVELNKKKGAFSYEGKCLLDTQYFKIEVKNHFIVVFIQENKQGLFSYEGIKIIPIKYSKLHFKKDFIEVFSNNKIGIISFEGKIILPIEYDSIEYLTNTLIKVKQKENVRDKGKEGIFSFTGETILPVIFDEISFFTKNLFLVTLNKKEGLFSLDGKLILPITFESLDKYNDNFIILTQNGNDGIFSIEKGSIMLPCIYSRLKFLPELILASYNGQTDIFRQEKKIISFPDTDIRFLSHNKSYIGLYDMMSSEIIILCRNTLTKKCSVKFKSKYDFCIKFCKHNFYVYEQINIIDRICNVFNYEEKQEF